MKLLQEGVISRRCKPHVVRDELLHHENKKMNRNKFQGFGEVKEPVDVDLESTQFIRRCKVGWGKRFPVSRSHKVGESACPVIIRFFLK